MFAQHAVDAYAPPTLAFCVLFFPQNLHNWLHLCTAHRRCDLQSLTQKSLEEIQELWDRTIRPWEETRGKKQREPASERDGHREFFCGEARHFLVCAWMRRVKQMVARGYQWRLCSAIEAAVVAVGRRGTRIELREESGGYLNVRAPKHFVTTRE